MTTFSLDANFSGGNILLEKIEGEHVFLRQHLRDTQGDWFYWAFRVRGAAGLSLKFHFSGSDVIGVRGPAMSLDGGQNWYWLGAECVSRHSNQVAFSYSFASDADEVVFALCPLYTQTELDLFLKRKSGDSRLKREVLCRSNCGREVELLRLGNELAQFRMLLLCRHHACEAMPSFCLEGILDAFLADDEIGHWLSKNVQVAAVPFVDKDGVEAGDQGKNRVPYDHNRDYGGNACDSIYPEVKALRQWAPNWIGDGQSNIVLDLHCPWIRGSHNEEVYFVGIPNAEIWRRVEEFSHLLETKRSGTLPFYQSDNLPWGQAWNTLSDNGIGKVPCATWAADLPRILFSTTLEIPYANAHGAKVTPETSRALGHDLACALYHYLRQSTTSH